MNRNLDKPQARMNSQTGRPFDASLRDQLARTVDQCPVSIVITNTAGAIEYVNPWFEKVTGYTAAEVIGHNPRVLKSGCQGAEFYREMWQTLSAGREWSGEFHNRRKDGQLFWERAAISPLRDEHGAVVNYVAVKEDITAQKLAAEALVAARDEAERANRAKSVFLANMSHELRTPLNVINGLAATLLEQELGSETRPLVQLISQSGGALLGIIEEVLEFAKIQAGHQQVERRDTDLVEVVSGSMDLAGEMTRGKPLQLCICVASGVPARVCTDARRLQQILVNLLGNAVKFTESGQVTLLVERRASSENTERLAFAVADSGPGIAPEVLPTLFQPFQQGDDSITRRFGGSGLGLAVSRSFARLMGGDVTARSAPQLGSVFTTELPLDGASGDMLQAFGWGSEMARRFIPWAEAAVRRRSVAPLPAVKTQSLGQRLPLRILAADDVATNRQVLQVIFRHLGYAPVIVADGAEAVAAVEAHTFDLVLLDVQMPVMDGITATREIRARFAHKPARPKIVALTANASEEDRRACLDAGMDDFLSKPVVPRQIEACFVRLFSDHDDAAHSSPESHAEASVSSTWVDAGHLAAIGEGLPSHQASEMLLQLAVTFGADFAAAMSRIEQACRERDAATLIELVHGLKGGAAMMGWTQFVAVCRSELDALRAGTFVDWGTLPEHLREVHRRSAVEFEHLLTHPRALEPQPA